MKFVVIGLSITSSWGNGHATTFRALLKELSKRGHEIIFLERDVDYYSKNRDLPNPEFCQLHLYTSNQELKIKFENEVASADVVMVGSYVLQGVEVGEWVTETAKGITAFYDIDTPVTMTKLKKGDYEYITPDLIPEYDIYFSFTEGPILKYIEDVHGSPSAKALYCSVDTEFYYPLDKEKKWDLGYLGTYSTDRQPTVDLLLNKVAEEIPEKHFVVAGPQYPREVRWPSNVERIQHLPPADHRDFYNAQKFTLNVTRQDMIKAGHSPSVRLFEAAACGIPIISDYWEGITDLFERDSEILIAENTEDVIKYLSEISEEERKKIGERGRQKIIEKHSAKARAEELENYILNLKNK